MVTATPVCGGENDRRYVAIQRIGSPEEGWILPGDVLHVEHETQVWSVMECQGSGLVWQAEAGLVLCCVSYSGLVWQVEKVR
jgi:hypothetical protein